MHSTYQWQLLPNPTITQLLTCRCMAVLLTIVTAVTKPNHHPAADLSLHGRLVDPGLLGCYLGDEVRVDLAVLDVLAKVLDSSLRAGLPRKECFLCVVLSFIDENEIICKTI